MAALYKGCIVPSKSRLPVKTQEAVACSVELSCAEHGNKACFPHTERQVRPKESLTPLEQ